MKAVVEEVPKGEMTAPLAAGYRERTPSHRRERNGPYTREPIRPVGK